MVPSTTPHLHIWIFSAPQLQEYGQSYLPSNCGQPKFQYQILKPCSIHSKLIDSMTELSYFSHTIFFARSNPAVLLDPAIFSEDLYYIEHQLLSFPTTIPAPSQERSIEKAYPLAGLLYTKAALQEISTFEKWFFHFSGAIEGSFDYSMDDGSGRTSSRLGLLRRLCFVERRLERMVRAVLDAALCMPLDISI
jgi:hypothetical protein